MSYEIEMFSYSNPFPLQRQSREGAFNPKDREFLWDCSLGCLAVPLETNCTWGAALSRFTHLQMSSSLLRLLQSSHSEKGRATARLTRLGQALDLLLEMCELWEAAAALSAPCPQQHWSSPRKIARLLWSCVSCRKGTGNKRGEQEMCW